MRWATHAMLGISTLWLLSPLPQDALDYDFGVLSAVAALGALLPDLDASESKIKHLRLGNSQFKPLLLPAQVVHRTDQHRGLLHSLVGLGMAGVLCAPLAFWSGWAPPIALLLGYGSHLVGDSATKSGMLLWYPHGTRYYLLPHRWRITTGSQAEEMFFVVTATLALLLLFQSLGLTA